MENRPLGRPARVKGKAVTVNLDPASHAYAALLGNGNVSAGLRLALQRVMAPPTPQFPPIPHPPFPPRPDEKSWVGSSNVGGRE